MNYFYIFAKQKYKGRMTMKMVSTSPNEHIGSMAALPPLERAVQNASLSPAGKYLEAATAPICKNVGRSR